MKTRTRNRLILVGIIAVAACLRSLVAYQLPPVPPDVLAQWQLDAKR